MTHPLLCSTYEVPLYLQLSKPEDGCDLSLLPILDFAASVAAAADWPRTSRGGLVDPGNLYVLYGHRLTG